MLYPNINLVLIFIYCVTSIVIILINGNLFMSLTTAYVYFLMKSDISNVINYYTHLKLMNSINLYKYFRNFG